MSKSATQDNGLGQPFMHFAWLKALIIIHEAIHSFNNDSKSFVNHVMNTVVCSLMCESRVSALPEVGMDNLVQLG